MRKLFATPQAISQIENRPSLLDKGDVIHKFIMEVVDDVNLVRVAPNNRVIFEGLVIERLPGEDGDIHESVLLASSEEYGFFTKNTAKELLAIAKPIWLGEVH